MPQLQGKNEYLMYVKSHDCIKDKITRCYKVEPVGGSRKIVPKKPKPKQSKETKIKETKEKEEPEITRLERKQKYKELKRTLQKEWSAEMESDDSDQDALSAPLHFKCYTIQDQKIVLQQPKRDPQKPGESYDGLENSKKIDLAEEGEETRPIWIASELEPEEHKLVETLREYRDVFAWSYRDLKGVDPQICQHTIPMQNDAKPYKQRPYTYNETFAKKIKEEIDKLKEAECIYEIEHTDWVSPIVVVPKKNGKLRVCVNLKKVNVATIRDNYPLPLQNMS